jgi:hypothetical protein
LEKVATALEARHAKVSRPVDAGPNRLYNLGAPDVKPISDIAAKMDFIKAAKELHADMTKTAAPAPAPTGVEAIFGITPNPQPQKQKNDRDRAREDILKSIDRLPDFGVPARAEKQTDLSFILGKPSGSWVGPASKSVLNTGRGYIENAIEMSLPTKAKKRMAVDTAKSYERAKANLMYLKMMDPIISQADDDEVQDYFESLVTAAPSLMQDKQLLAQKLRKAIQYEGIDTLDIQELANIDDSKAKAEKLEGEIGGTPEKYKIKPVHLISQNKK